MSYFKECNNKWDLTIGGDAYGIDCISNQWNPMHSWIPDDIDKIYYFEHIETILDDISNRLQLDLSPELNHINQSQHKNYREYYDSGTRNKVYELYKEDFIRFNYCPSLNR